MAGDLGPESWTAQQLRKFLEGINAVGTVNAPKVQRAEWQRRVQVVPDKNPRVSIPAWDDVIRLGPRPVVTKEDYELRRHFKRYGLPSPLSPELEGEIQRRKDVMDKINNSAIPEYQRGLATMMTVVDNVQDATLTLAVAGRIAMTALGRFGAWMAPAVAGMTSAALVLNWLGIALAIFGVGYAFACQGPRDALSQARANALAGYLFTGLRGVVPRLRGLPSPFAPAGGKGRHGAASFGVPTGRAVNNKRSSRWGKAAPSFGELLQAGQVAYDHTGWGIALGGVIGMSAESAYGGKLAGLGVKVATRSPEMAHALERLLSSRVAQMDVGAVWFRWQCARAVAAAPFIMRDPWTHGDEVYALAWVAFYACLEPLMGDLDGIAWREPMIQRLGVAAWTPVQDPDPVTAMQLEELGVSPQGDVWPVPGSPRELTAEYLVVTQGQEISDALRRWLEEKPFEPLRRFVAELAMNCCERVWYFLEGNNDWPAWTLSPFSCVFESLMLAERWPILSDPIERLELAWAMSEAYCRDTDERFIPVDELDRIWTDAGTPLLRIRPGGSELDMGTFLPVDADTRSSSGVAFGQDLAEARRKLEVLLRAEPPAAP